MSWLFEDSNIAVIARQHNLVIVTGKEKDFHRPGLRVFNPSRTLSLRTLEIVENS